MNYFKTFTLMALLTMLFVFVGNLIGGNSGMLLAFGLAIVMNFFSYWFSDKIVLAMYGAKEADKAEYKQLYALVGNLASRASIPMPKVYVLQAPMANAFATGRNPEHSALAVTAMVLELLDAKELEAVLAHEISHIKNRDILIGTIAATFAGAITMAGSMVRWAAIFGGIGKNEDRGGGAIGFLVLAILAPFAALLIQLAISRSREYEADNGSAEITGRPQYLISALEKLTSAVSKKTQQSATPATAHMFIVNPFKGGGLTSLFSTHPSLEQRKENLKKKYTF